MRKILKKIKNFLPEIKRIVGQFFETEYFYRWRKVTYHDWFDGEHTKTVVRALSHLNNTWDGDISILNILDDKIFHMYVNLRKYGSTTSRYINGKDVLKDGTKAEKTWGFYRMLDTGPSINITNDTKPKNGIKREAKLLYITESSTEENASYYFAKVKDTHKFEEVDEFYSIVKCVSTKSDKTITTFVVDSKTGDIVEKKRPIYKSQYKLLYNLENQVPLKQIIDLFEYKLSIKITEKDLYTEIAHNAIDVYPEDYLHLSDKMKRCISGRIKGLHSLWQFRRMLNNLNNMSSDDEPYNTELNEAYKEDDEEKRQALMEQAWNHFKKDKKEYARKIADFWCENSGSWWD